MSEISTKPYMLRAIYEWCADSGYTPYIAIKVDRNTRVPMEFVKNGEIVLNISFGATSGLKMDNDFIQFHARFGGVSREILVPVQNVLAIYANENGQGMMFDAPPPIIDEPVVSTNVVPKSGPRGVLKGVPTSALATSKSGESLTSSDLSYSSSDVRQGDGDDNSPPPKKNGKPNIVRIK